jgi:hypothetical protein
MEQAMPAGQETPDRTRTEQYLRLVRPAVRGCPGVLVAVAAISAASAAGGRTGLVVASGYLAFIGSYCVLNFRQCRETHCAITGPGWTAAAFLGIAAALAPGRDLSWYRLAAESIAAITICALGYALEWAIAARTGRHALR